MKDNEFKLTIIVSAMICYTIMFCFFQMRGCVVEDRRGSTAVSK